MPPKPVRLQRSRAKGAHLVSPNGLEIVYVGRGRGCKWGNPFESANPADAVFMFEQWLLSWQPLIQMKMPSGCYCVSIVGDMSQYHRAAMLTSLSELRGKNLSCWCKPSEPCHADVLLRIANEEREP